ncbi:MAG TPA: T9SS type A sorting domain-containing protein, partial [Bacteroidales bacterium]|nr:T9SS type A sorting domain-containing protein [Bacteroidales bacterium]
TNHADNSFGDQWFVYTATANKMVRVSTCGLTTEKTYVQVYKGGCDWVNWFGESSWACGGQSDLSFVADSGETYYIVWRNWYTSGNYDWVLSERDILPGDFCENAINAQVDTNHADNSFGDQWFVYTATANKMVTISTCGLTTEDTYVVVYNNCNGTAITSNDDNCSTQSKVAFNADSGQTYYIRWKNTYTRGNYDWELSERDILPGDKCENPVIARLGNNHAATSLGTRWFVFTPDQTANYIINACVGDSSFAGSLYINSGNCSFLIYEESAWLSCDWTGTTSVTLNAGQTYYITFTHDKNEDFQWTLLREEPPTKADTIEGPVALCSDINNVVYRAPSIENATAYRWTISGYSVVDSVVTTNADSLVIAQLPATSSFTITVKGMNPYGEGPLDSLSVTVHPTPERPIVTRSGNVLTSSATTGNQWYNLSGLIAGATGQSYTVTSDGSYYVVVTSEAGCVSKASDTIEVIISSIASSVISDHLRIFPNPVTEQLTIELVNSKSPASYVLYGVDGKQVAKGQFVGSVTLSTKQLKAGMYTLRVVQDGNVEVRKVLKQ